MKECNNVGKYTNDEAPYIAGWRYIAISVYDSYNERPSGEILMHVCESCMGKFKDLE